MREPGLAKILRWFVYGVAFVPLIIFSQYVSPFHFGKVVVFRSMVELMLAMYLVLIWQDRSYRPKTNRIFWAFLAFAGAFSIATATSVIPYMSFWGTLERMGGLFTFWHYFAFFVIATSVMRTREQWMRFLDLTIFVGILSSFYGFGQKTNISFFVGSGGRARIFGTIGNAALFAGYEIVNFFLALTFYLRTGDSAGKKFLYGTEIAVGGLAIIMTVVRGSLMGLGAGILVFTSLYFVQFNSKKARKILLLFSVAAALFFMIIVTPIKNASFFTTSGFLHRLTDTSFESYTAKTRFWAWQAGLKGWRDNFKTIALGWGPENFNVPFSKYFNPKFFQGPGSETLFDRAHNMFVEVLVTMGLVGLLTYVNIFWSAFASLGEIARRKPEEQITRIGLTSLLIAYMIHNSFIFDTSANFIVFFSVLGFISFHLNLSQAVSEKHPQRNAFAALRPAHVFALVILLTVALIFAYKINVLPAKANYATTRAILAGWANDFSGAMGKYHEALTYNGAGRYEFRQRAAQYLLEYSTSNKLTPQIKDEILYVIGEVQKNVDENPHDYLPHLYLSRLYITLGKEDSHSPYNDKALEQSAQALEISPTFVRTYYEVAQGYLNKGDYANAIAAFKKAAELNPDVGISYWYWGVTTAEFVNVKDGLAIIKEGLDKGYQPDENDYSRLINIYLKINDNVDLVTAFEGLIKIAPNNAKYHASLAVAYARIGRVDDAVNEAHKASELDPNFTNDAKGFVESLERIW